MSPRRVTVRVPATSANLGSGFDCLGITLDLWAEVTLTADSTVAVRPTDPLLAMIDTAARSLYAAIGREAPAGLRVTWSGDLPIARGLGASAAVRAGGLLAANALCSEPLTRDELLALGDRLEGHADNVAPALFGGLQVVVKDDVRIVHLGLPVPDGLQAVLFVPELAMPTAESRKLLPANLTRADAVHNIGRAALLVAALAAGRWELLDVATQDRLHQPARAQLFPAMYDLFAAARQAGALCAYLSGGGSTVAALARRADAQSVMEGVKARAAQQGVAGRALTVGLSNTGASVIATE